MEMLLRPEPTVAKDLIHSLDETRVGILRSFPWLLNMFFSKNLFAPEEKKKTFL